ncbi:hypothetical protein ZIOFF_030723 [Zingiber officinale]|uniref:U-box domain-containing protein n=1 Tax=Zingiber officinale TaxID=94328 RepID=A0A8J5GRD1_ZINOF|nr:hypothetical protein ZIOFF_030723 [Zingiber officinale]
MLSLADCASVVDRSLGRSARTVSPSASRRSSTVSGEMTDSVVDLQLHELAKAPSLRFSSSPTFGESAAELLDLSRDFSRHGSFDCDVSGELRRLALIPPDEVGPSAVDSLTGDVEALMLEIGDMEEASIESVEPAVKACLEGLVSTSTDTKRAAAAAIRLLAKHRSDFRLLIGASGAIPLLVPLLKNTDPETQETAVTALLNLSLEVENQGPIMAAGAVKPLVYVLRTGTAVAKQNAACALLSLSMEEENRVPIGASGSIPPLVALLVGGTSRGKKDSLTTLYKLCSSRRNKERAVRAGAVSPLLVLAGDHGGGMAEKALVVLGSLATIPEGMKAIVDTGGMPVLVEAMQEGPTRGREFAVQALLQLCADSTANRGLLAREGVIPPLVALSQAGSSRGKQKVSLNKTSCHSNPIILSFNSVSFSLSINEGGEAPWILTGTATVRSAAAAAGR